MSKGLQETSYSCKRCNTLHAVRHVPGALQGERLPLAVKDLGSCDLYPQSLQHNPNGRFVTVCGDGEYIIYTALAWRNKSFGTAVEFVWAYDSNTFATRYAALHRFPHLATCIHVLMAQQAPCKAGGLLASGSS